MVLPQNKNYQFINLTIYQFNNVSIYQFIIEFESMYVYFVNCFFAIFYPEIEPGFLVVQSRPV